MYYYCMQSALLSPVWMNDSPSLYLYLVPIDGQMSAVFNRLHNVLIVC